jgi:dephospho-CoA kinase
MNRNKRIIAFAGRNGSGKETAADHAARSLKAPHHTYSDILVETFALWGVTPSSRPQQQSLSTSMRDLLGQDAMAKVMDKKCAEATSSDVIIDGVRRMDDIKSLRLTYGANFFLVWIETSVSNRYERLKSRKAKKGESMMSFEDFLKQEVAETEIQLDEVRGACSYHFDNNGTIQILHRQVDGFLTEIDSPSAA